MHYKIHRQETEHGTSIHIVTEGGLLLKNAINSEFQIKLGYFYHADTDALKID